MLTDSNQREKLALYNICRTIALPIPRNPASSEVSCQTNMKHVESQGEWYNTGVHDMKQTGKIVLSIFSVPVLIWVAAAVYFTIAGHDLPNISFDQAFPSAQNLKPEENAYTAIKEFAQNRMTNNTPLSGNYRLRQAYLDGQTNRLELTEEARAFIAAESDTIAVVKRILDAKGIEIPFEEVLQANYYICYLQRIIHVYKAKAIYEAANGNLAAGRRSLMDAYEVGRFLQTHNSLLQELSSIISHTICAGALTTAEKPLFAPNGDEDWLKKLRALYLSIDVDKESVKTSARMRLAGPARALVNIYTAEMRLKTIIDEYAKITGENSVVYDAMKRTVLFLTALTTACPGFIRYSFQPNRSLNAIQTDLNEFCRKVDEPEYDVKYANDSNHGEMRFLYRNWLGNRIFSTFKYNSAYKLMFRTRFWKQARMTILACRSHKTKYGKYPETLSELCPEFLPYIPRDPYDGCELRYNAKEGFIWTRGEKLSFDGIVQITPTGKPYFRRIGDSRCVVFLEGP